MTAESGPMKIGIINAGNIGGTLARLWAAAGHELFLSRDGAPTSLDPILEDIGERAQAGTLGEAASFSDVLLFSVYWGRAQDVLDQLGPLDGKVVLETLNPVLIDEDSRAHVHDHAFMATNGSTSEWLQERAPNAQIVKAFNTLPSELLDARVWPEGERPAIMFAGGDATAKRIAAQLIGDAGFPPINVGPLEAARQLEQLGLLFHHVVTERDESEPFRVFTLVPAPEAAFEGFA
jgi:8-hydroxy-5-deazaflavin:NADPH oxidoreductase